MLNTKRDHDLKKDDGFTIVETLIVLAIAGLIILIVLLAVPALQRASRNTNMKNDASTVASQVSDFESNNSGALPTSITSSTPGTVSVTGTTTGSIPSSAKVQASDVISTVSGTVPQPVSTNGGARDGHIIAYISSTCSGQKVVRSVAIVYPVDITGSTTGVRDQCLDA